MFDNIGGKIKMLGKIIAYVGIALSLIGGIVIMLTGRILFSTGLFLMFAGPISSLISGWIVYGFGQLIEDTSDIASYAKKKHRMINGDSDKNIFTMNKNTTNK